MEISVNNIAGTLARIEADVVFVGYNSAHASVHVQPIWECDMPEREFPAYAAMLALAWTEQDGGGGVSVTWRDFRDVDADATLRTLMED